MKITLYVGDKFYEDLMAAIKAADPEGTLGVDMKDIKCYHSDLANTPLRVEVRAPRSMYSLELTERIARFFASVRNTKKRVIPINGIGFSWPQ